MNVTIAYGFLGAGKTSILLHWIPRLRAAGRTAFVVNEFGKEGIDQVVLQTESLTVRSLVGGCVCCELRGELPGALQQLDAELRPERVIIEPTGLAAPKDLGPLFGAPPLAEFARVDSIVTVVDAVRHEAARAVFGAFYPEQIIAADVVVINKIDLATGAQQAGARRMACAINPRATVVATTHGQADWDLVSVASARHRPSAGPSFDAERAVDHAHTGDVGRVSTLGLERVAVHPAALRRPALDRLVADLAAGEFGDVLRAKGFVPTPNGVIRVDVVMGLIELRPSGDAPARLEVIGRNLRHTEMEYAFTHGLTELTRSGRATA
ncbi:MAG: GTP-binding protein [Actinobacteria bacterium]|nr:GTP-binding protein [Actinomycetota bacterium]